MLRALDRAVRHSAPTPTALIVNYPVQPDRACGRSRLLPGVVAFARETRSGLLSDLAYAEIYFERQAAALGPAGGGRQGHRRRGHIAVQDLLHGRLARRLCRRQRRLFAALARVKSYLDYGAFTPIQVAAAAALNGPQDCVEEIRAIYKRAATCWSRPCTRPAGTSRRRRPRCSPGRPCPSRSGTASLEFSKLLIEEAGRRGRARRRLRRIWRGLCAHRAGRERAPHPPGRAQRAEVPRRIGRDHAAAIPTPARPDRTHEPDLADRHRRPRHGRQRAAAAAGARNADSRARAGRPVEVAGVSARIAPEAAAFRSRTAAAGSTIPWRWPPIPTIDVFVELIGGADGPAKAAVEAALAAGKPVVTANKALIAVHGAELARAGRATASPLLSRRRWPAASRR